MAKRPPSRGTRGRSSGGMTGMASRIIHSGWLPLLRKASTTLSRLANFTFFWTEVSVRMRSRRSTASCSTSMRFSSSLMASAPMEQRSLGYLSRSWR